MAEAEALYKQGRASFETANYLDAIDQWTQAYALVEDVPENASTKAALIYNIASAQEKAYSIDTDITHLRQAVVLMETYAQSVPALYGEGPQGDAEASRVQARLAELRARIEEVRSDAPVPTPTDSADRSSDPSADPSPDSAPEPLPPPPAEPDPKAKPFIIAGAVTAGLGVAGLGMMAAGLAMGSAANDVDPRAEIIDRRAQFDRGRTGNTLAIAGGAVGGGLLVVGAVLLGMGLEKRSGGAMAVTPVVPVGRGSTAGVRLVGRF